MESPEAEERDMEAYNRTARIFGWRLVSGYKYDGQRKLDYYTDEDLGKATQEEIEHFQKTINEIEPRLKRAWTLD